MIKNSSQSRLWCKRRAISSPPAFWESDSDPSMNSRIPIALPAYISSPQQPLTFPRRLDHISHSSSIHFQAIRAGKTPFLHVQLTYYSPLAMVLAQLYCLVNMDKSPEKINKLSLPLFDTFYSHVLILACSLRDFFWAFWFPILSQLDLGFPEGDETSSQSFERRGDQVLVSKKLHEDDHSALCIGDVERVMGQLGLFCSHESDDEELQDRFGSDDFSRLFEEKEPSLEELKHAFDVYDFNGEGFIDAGKLQRVCCILGLKEGSEVNHCARMISTADVNGDGKIDFKAFVKFMENSFC